MNTKQNCSGKIKRNEDVLHIFTSIYQLGLENTGHRIKNKFETCTWDKARVNRMSQIILEIWNFIFSVIRQYYHHRS